MELVNNLISKIAKEQLQTLDVWLKDTVYTKSEYRIVGELNSELLEEMDIHLLIAYHQDRNIYTLKQHSKVLDTLVLHHITFNSSLFQI